MAARPIAGVYVHIPFCERVCPYCDFAVEGVGQLPPEREAAYVDALLRELEARAPVFADCELQSVYLGGGTPSLLQPESLARIRAAVTGAFEWTREPLEVTLEVNPSTTERDRLPAFRSESGVDRLSVGVQSFDDSVLKALGRAHRADACRLTLEAARAAGFANLSLDLIFAALHQTPEMLERDLDETIAFAPEHVSTYELVMEEGTPFGRAAAAGRLHRYDEDAAAEMLERIEQRLGEAGLARYELTNYARPGRESVHNRLYWAREPVLGLGAGAHSTDPPDPVHPFGVRRANPRGVADYLAWAAGCGDLDAAPEIEVVDRRHAMAESVFLALRCAPGLSARRFAASFVDPPRAIFGEAIDDLVARGLLTESPDGDLALTREGRLLADTVCARFV